MIRVREFRVPIEKDNKEFILKKISKLLKFKVFDFKINKKSIDARDKNNIIYVYELLVESSMEDIILKKNKSKNISKYNEEKYDLKIMGNKKLDKPVIVGSGPAGLFCAYLLAEAGYRPIIMERGEKIEERVKTIEKFFSTNKLNINSNIQFGEGGAGTFSDGKLNTLTKDNIRQKKVFEIFVECGAPEEILYLNKPHIGTDILRKVIINMRNKIISMGGEFRYNSCVTDLIIDDDRVSGVVINNNERINSDVVVLAIGHSARDTFYMLNSHHILMRPKNFAVGVRIEHPRDMIDKSQYGDSYRSLDSASYKLTYKTKEGRSVYSFCMCPGGFVVNASSEKGRLCVNGMSNYKRDETNSNSALVVSVNTDDFNNELFGGLEFQRNLEEAAYREGNGLIPVQLYKDFKKNVPSYEVLDVIPNTKGDYKLSNLNNVLPDFISSSLKEALPEFGKKIRGFDREDAILLGVESRTSSPVIIVRDANYNSSIYGLYPCGEGAGYAGGITTASVDGIKVAEAICKEYRPGK